MPDTPQSPRPGTLNRPMRWRLFKSNMSVSAPRMTVRAQMPWALKALLAFVFAVLAAAAGVGIYEYGRNFAGPDRKQLAAELEQVQSQLREVKADRDRLQAVATSWESQIKVERAAQDKLVEQARALEVESNKLREDLSFFESLLPAGAGNKGLVIRSFRVQAEGEPNVMRYRLLVQQSGKSDVDFVGAVQLSVNFMQNGRGFTLQLPEPNAASERLQSLALSFRHYQRVEGSFTLPAGAVVRSVHVKVLRGAEVQTQQTFTL
jgi:cell division protein FtsL